MSIDIVIIGGGPGGYVAAIRAAQKGAKVVLIEEERIGGVCLNSGCIPTKVLHKHASLIKDIKNAKNFGIDIPHYFIDFLQMMKRKNDVIETLTSGISQLLKKNKVIVISGKAKIKDKNEVVVLSDGKLQSISCKNIIIATGSQPLEPPIKGLDNEGVITSKDLLQIKEIPKTMAIIGGGVIGIEFSSIFNMLGTKVYVIEKLPNILSNLDKDISQGLKNELIKNGVQIKTNCGLKKVIKKEDILIIKTQNNEEIKVEKVLVSIGRKAVIPEIDIDIILERGAIKVNKYLQTNFDNIYAVGDVNGKHQLAHVAYAEGIKAVDNILSNKKEKMDYKVIPNIVYSLPEVASVGLNEEEAKKISKIRTSTFPYYANGKALCLDEKVGFIKIIADEKWNEILGVHILGYNASNIIGEAGIAISLEATAKELAETIHAHPTISEIIMEAAEEIVYKSIHK